ncbi:hypothetical protein M527_13985 [Sphingobium indicum IP26]|nr:hypothetical protein M527_13985 [Sphingobium indicum IP26]
MRRLLFGLEVAFVGAAMLIGIAEGIINFGTKIWNWL